MNTFRIWGIPSDLSAWVYIYIHYGHIKLSDIAQVQKPINTETKCHLQY